MSLPIAFGAEVADAKARAAPIVALESTIITHGMPFPDNLATARAVEQDVRDAGATPATIAVWGGKIRVGLADAELDALAEQSDAWKLSRADLPFALVRGVTGSTTVAATMIAARLSGISVFATGGIGGVHKGAEQTFDISADLLELAQTPVMVICAGAKAILDIPKTLEVLETQGVPVVTYGQSALPAFWSRSSQTASPLVADTLEEIAAAFALRRRLEIPGGQLVCNPVPLADEIPQSRIAPYIAQATEEAAARGITGKDVTPFVLGQIVELTNGSSLKTNVALVRNNAKVAAKLARILADMDVQSR